MINLLPPEEKAKLLFEKRKKLIAILGITAIVPLLCLILILISIRIFILGEVNAEEIVLEQARRDYQTPDFLSFKDVIQKNDKILTRLESFYKKETYFTAALKIISSIPRPANLYLTNITLGRTKDYRVKVTASGFSKSRDDLISFQKSINENQGIQNASFSPESWVAPQNVKFNVTFEIK